MRAHLRPAALSSSDPVDALISPSNRRPAEGNSVAAQLRRLRRTHVAESRPVGGETAFRTHEAV